MKKKQNPYLIPIAASLLVGIFLGYSLSYFAPNLSAALVRWRKSPSTSTTANSQQGSQGLCPRQNPNENMSQGKYAFCTPFQVPRPGQKSSTTLYTCNNTACGGVASGDIYSDPSVFGFAKVPNSNLYFQNCSLQACWDSLKYGYYRR